MKLIKGDCLEVLKQLEDNSVDMVLTDPPYGTTACKWDTVIPFEPMWEQLHRVTKDNGAICLFGSEPFSSALRMSNIKRFKYDWVWHKSRATGFAMSKKRPLKGYELIGVFYYKQPKYYPQKIKKGKPNNNKAKGNAEAVELMNSESQPTLKKVKVDKSGLKHPDGIIEFKSIGPSVILHPTQKPVALLEYLIKTYTLEGETVLDFTMGSGSTGVACVNLNRNFIGIEQDDTYFKIAETRINEGEEAAINFKKMLDKKNEA